MRRLLLTALSAALAVPAVAAPAIADDADYTKSYCWSKHTTPSGGHMVDWQGTWGVQTPSGCHAAPHGSLHSWLTSISAAPTDTKPASITITWQFFRPGGHLLFETQQAGTLSLTGAVVLDGTVTAGARPGAPTHDTGQATDAALSFSGVMSVGVPAGR